MALNLPYDGLHSIQFNSIQFNSVQFSSVQFSRNEYCCVFVANDDGKKKERQKYAGRFDSEFPIFVSTSSLSV